MPPFTCPGFDGISVTDEKALESHLAQQAVSLGSGAFAQLLQKLLANPAFQAFIQNLIGKWLNPPTPTPAP